MTLTIQQIDQHKLYKWSTVIYSTFTHKIHHLLCLEHPEDGFVGHVAKLLPSVLGGELGVTLGTDGVRPDIQRVLDLSFLLCGDVRVVDFAALLHCVPVSVGQKPDRDSLLYIIIIICMVDFLFYARIDFCKISEHQCLTINHKV